MKHVIIGTAGHVDHGKTLLVKALTGIDTDRLEEEKKRGITIDLGFAHLDWPDGTQAGLVDVPGHEKFIKNMLAGAGGIDLAMLVVAADEGFMPQTEEHLHILQLLGIQDGLVVLTKTDMVDEDWLDMMVEEVAEKLKGSFLEGKAIVPVSARTGEGIVPLREKLHQMVTRASGKNLHIPFRLPVDRIFSVDGFGTVVTGTLIEGCMNEGDLVELVPSGTESRIRSLQVHGERVDVAYAGQRVAVNLVGLKRSDIHRGDTVTRPGTVRSSLMLDVRLEHLADSKRMIENHMQVHLYHGSSVHLAKIALLDRDVLEPGQSCYAQLRLSEAFAGKQGDSFVIRFYSPLETIGGGRILDDVPSKHRRFDKAVLEALAVKESGSVGERVLQLLQQCRLELPTLPQLLLRMDMDSAAMEQELAALIATGQVIEPLQGQYIASSVVDQLASTAKEVLTKYHSLNPLHAGMVEAELRQKLLPGMPLVQAKAVMQALCGAGLVKRQKDRFADMDFQVVLSKKQVAIRQKIVEQYHRGGLDPVTVDALMASFLPKEQGDAKQVMESLLGDGSLIRLSPQIWYGEATWKQVTQAVGQHFQAKETITLAELRDALQTSRKYALAILEYLDKTHVTKKEGDFRMLKKGFDVESLLA